MGALLGVLGVSLERVGSSKLHLGSSWTVLGRSWGVPSAKTLKNNENTWKNMPKGPQANRLPGGGTLVDGKLLQQIEVASHIAMLYSRNPPNNASRASKNRIQLALPPSEFQ